MKTVLYISPDISVKGGISTVIKDYLSSDLAERHKIILVGTNKDGSQLFKMAIAIKGLLQTLFYLLFRSIGIVHIHGSDYVSSKRKFVYFKIARWFSCKIIYHFHGASFMEQYPALSGRWKARFKKLFEVSDLVICLSQSWKKNVLSIAPLANIVVVPNSITLPVLDASRKRNETVQLTFLGRVCDRKGTFDLLNVTKMLIDKGIKIKLSIGGNGEIDRLMAEVKRLRVTDDNLEYLGWASPEVRDTLLRKTDIFILPSYGEGMPMTILEAMSYGVPVISTPVGGIPELVIDNETGFLIEPGDIISLYNKIVELAADQEKRNRFGLRGREIIQQKHNITDNIRVIDDIYRTI